MTSQALVLVGMLVVVVLALAAVAGALLSPTRRAARRARALEKAEEADRLRNDPNGQVDPAVYRWQAKASNTARNPPGAGMPLN